jgi:hypothetical protein
MQYLPDPEEQEWLIKELSVLLEKCGAERFLEGPIVEPMPKFFPDPWSSNHQSLDRLVRRLMQYAGLGDLDVLVGTLRNVQAMPIQQQTTHESVAGLFLGIHENQCVFFFDQEMLGDAEYMAGVMAHEVAHAFRARHALVVSDMNVEECLTDVTTSYLGFGILATDISYRYRTGSFDSPGSYFWSVRGTGYLTPQAHAFLMATQMVVRDIPTHQRRHLLAYLETNQAAFTRAALKELEDRRTELFRTFNCEWAPKTTTMSLEQILKPLPEYSPLPDAEDVEERRTFNAGRPVFKITRTWATLGAGIGLVFGIALGITLWVGIDHFFMAPLGALSGAAIGAILGRRHSFEICSEPACKSVLGNDLICPGCGGTIAGSIRRLDDRLEAAEKWEQQKAGKS